MGRQARVRSSAGLYHVMLRGADRHILFADDADCRGFILSLQRAKESGGCNLYTYCLMDNHVHLLLRENEEPLETVIKRIGVSYAYHYNLKYELHGHLFQDRYRSEAIETDAYFLDVLRYICQNPVKAGLVQNPLDYPWLGCNGVKDEYHLTDPLSDYTSLNGEELLRFINEPCKADHIEPAERKRLTDREAIAKATEACGCIHVPEICKWPAEKQEEAVQKILDSGVSIRQLSRITGISKAIIERISCKTR